MVVAMLVLGHAQISPTLEPRLHHLFAGLKGVQMSRDGGELVVKYKTETGYLPSHLKSRTTHVKLISIEKPAATGFLLKVTEYAHAPGAAFEPFQAVRTNAGWLTDYGTWKSDTADVQVRNSGTARRYELSWGAKFDLKLLGRIRRELAR